jgi:hypothetical protein
MNASLPLFDDSIPIIVASEVPAMERAPLRPLYYLHNFRVAMESLRDRYTELMSPEESQFIQCFLRLPEAAQCLFTRLAMRKGPFFRRNKLRYPEIPDIAQALDVLTWEGLIDLDPAVEAATLPEVLNKAELRWILGTASSRARCVESARDQLDLPIENPIIESRRLSRWHEALKDRFIQLTVDGLIRRLQWLFFGNDHQDWTEFVLTDLGAVRYEHVPFDARSRAFQSREDLELACMRANPPWPSARPPIAPIPTAAGCGIGSRGCTFSWANAWKARMSRIWRFSTIRALAAPKGR